MASGVARTLSLRVAVLNLGGTRDWGPCENLMPGGPRWRYGGDAGTGEQPQIPSPVPDRPQMGTSL